MASDNVETLHNYAQLEALLYSPDIRNWELAFALLEGQSLPLSQKLYQIICSDMGRLTICIEQGHIELLRPFKSLHIQGISADNPLYRHRFADAMGQLTHLEELYWIGRNFLFNTNYVQALPKLKNLKRLRLTQLYFNELERIICELDQLEWLDLSQNHLSNLPEAFNNLKNLSFLNLSHCYFKTIPAVLYELPQLKQLSMIGNPMDYLDLPAMKRLKNLEQLVLAPIIVKRYKLALREILSPIVFEHPSWKNIN